ncbi:hypothetical protein E2562_006649 [Oryza meyeriana var. granulata]|uniref:Uncharacterized protein n=1 Tax=Oryza meyeriana var. granulata TaxID=110450 RepID=A0A6G1EG62_9ORYZ|nr:hypothetical protein E2562_006649 [Oryza meyeriana var. granulata]
MQWDPHSCLSPLVLSENCSGMVGCHEGAHGLDLHLQRGHVVGRLLEWRRRRGFRHPGTRRPSTRSRSFNFLSFNIGGSPAEAAATALAAAAAARAYRPRWWRRIFPLALTSTRRLDDAAPASRMACIHLD